MRKLHFETHFNIYKSVDELPEKAKKLMLKAIQAREKAYAPYSNFRVGAAVSLKNETIITGSNQENAAYPSGLCAERVAIFQASSQFPDEEITAIAISGSAKDTTKLPVSPCGACRQSIAEYEIKQKQPITIYFMGAVGQVVEVHCVKDLLPLLFDGSLL